jgi:hypothetical protein
LILLVGVSSQGVDLSQADTTDCCRTFWNQFQLELSEYLALRCHINWVTMALAIQYCLCMQKISYARHRFPPEIIRHAI